MNASDHAIIRAAVKAVEKRVGFMSLQASSMRRILRKLETGEELSRAEAAMLSSELRAGPQ